MSRPRLVTAPISERLEVSSADRTASCLLRRCAGVMRSVWSSPGCGRSTLAIRPVLLRYTRVGESDTSSTAAVLRVEAPAMLGRASVSRVRRGVPNLSEMAASSSETRVRMACLLASRA